MGPSPRPPPSMKRGMAGGETAALPQAVTMSARAVVSARASGRARGGGGGDIGLVTGGAPKSEKALFEANLQRDARAEVSRRLVAVHVGEQEPGAKVDLVAQRRADAEAEGIGVVPARILDAQAKERPEPEGRRGLDPEVKGDAHLGRRRRLRE